MLVFHGSGTAAAVFPLEDELKNIADGFTVAEANDARVFCLILTVLSRQH